MDETCDEWYSWQYYFSYVIHRWRSGTNLLHRWVSFLQLYAASVRVRNRSHDSVPNSYTYCFFSRCFEQTSFLYLKHFIWHGNTETTWDNLASWLEQYLSREQETSDCWQSRYTNVLRNRRNICLFMHPRVITQLDTGPYTGLLEHEFTPPSLSSTLILSHHNQPFRITYFKHISPSIRIPYSPPILSDVFHPDIFGSVQIMKLFNMHFSPRPFCFVTFRCKQSPKHPVFKHKISILK
jgi:hypothetical protein